MSHQTREIVSKTKTLLSLLTKEIEKLPSSEETQQLIDSHIEALKIYEEEEMSSYNRYNDSIQRTVLSHDLLSTLVEASEYMDREEKYILTLSLYDCDIETELLRLCEFTNINGSKYKTKFNSIDSTCIIECIEDIISSGLITLNHKDLNDIFKIYIENYIIDLGLYKPGGYDNPTLESICEEFYKLLYVNVKESDRDSSLYFELPEAVLSIPYIKVNIIYYNTMRREHVEKAHEKVRKQFEIQEKEYQDSLKALAECQ